MKVLFICPFVPWPLENGGKIRTYHLLRAVSQHAEVHLRIIREPGMRDDTVAALSEWCADVELYDRARPGPWRRWARPKIERWFHSPGLIEAVRRDLARREVHLVHLDELLLARVVSPGHEVPVVQHHHKLDTVLYGRLSAGQGARRHFDLWKLRRLEAESARRYRHHLLCSREDADLLRSRHGALDCAVVPSGVDPAYFRQPGDAAPETDRLVFVGSMNYGPNVDGVVHFVRDVLPAVLARRPRTVLEVVGGHPPDEVRALEGEHVRVTGRVDDVRPFLARATAAVVPLRIGGGTRLKIVEALAMGTPVVSTRVGAEGLGLADGQHLALADGAEALARACVEVLEHPEPARAAAARGRQQVLQRYSWSVLAEELVDYWERVAFSGSLSPSR